MLKQLKRVLLVSMVGTLMSTQVFAAGFEKSVFWSGHYTGIAGAAQSSVTGPESLYWNPAALAGSTGLQMSANFSPTLSQYSGPMALTTTTGTVGNSQSSNTSFSPIGAGFISYGITPKFGVGIGYYVSGGTRADYDSVTPSSSLVGITLAPPLKADLSITELSAGAGYEIIPGLKIGAAYRVMFTSATLDTAGATSIGGGAAALISTQISGISQTSWTGFRVGLQYEPKDSPWGFGIVYRNQVSFNAPGTANVFIAGTTGNGAGVASGNGSQVGTNESVLVNGQLPQSINAAAHYAINPEWTAFAGYTFTNYAQDQTLGISGVTAGTLGTGGIGALTNTQTSIPLGWNNQHNVRVAGEYTGIQDWALRAGYVWTSQVTPNGEALPIIASPGTGNTIVVGAGHKLCPNLTVDGAFEHSWDSGSVASADNPLATTAQGSYTASAYVLHLGATYVF